MSAIVREVLICHQITVSLDAVNRMSLRQKTKYSEYFTIRYYSKDLDEIKEHFKPIPISQLIFLIVLKIKRPK